MSGISEWFSQSGNSEIVTALMAVASLIVSIIALNKSNKTQHRLLEIEEIREEDRTSQRKKAELLAELIREEGNQP